MHKSGLTIERIRRLQQHVEVSSLECGFTLHESWNGYHLRYRNKPVSVLEAFPLWASFQPPGATIEDLRRLVESTLYLPENKRLCSAMKKED